METAPYVFGDFRLDPASFELLRLGERVSLERIPLELLILLASRRGALVTREEIAQHLWGSDVFIDTNTAINVAMRKIRQALDDSIDKPRFILTVPTKGYRFVGTISDPQPIPTDSEKTDEPASLVPRIEEPASQPTHTLTDRITRHRNLLLGVVFAVLLAVALFAAVHKWHHPPPDRLMFVVLPFANLTGDPSQEYIADGMTEEMITRLGSLDPGHIFVIARTSAMGFKGTQKSITQIARELGVSYLLEGSVRHVGDRMRVTAQLIQASDQTHLWASDYDSDLGNLLQLQTDIADAIANQVQLKLNRGTGLQGIHPVRPEAQAAYLRGLEEWNLRTGPSIKDAIAQFQQAIAIDSGYALPFAALARCYVLGPIFGRGSPLETMPKARELAAHALQLDPGLAEAHSILAMVYAHYDYDWPNAEREFRIALRMNPSDPYAHLFYSNSFLSPHGRHQEAISELQTAIRLDPLAAPAQAYLVRTYAWARRYDDARAQFQRTVEVAPNLAVLHERAAHLFATTGDFQKAIEEDATACLLSGQGAEQVILRREEQRKAWKEEGPRGYWKSQLALSHETSSPPEAYTTSFGVAIIQAQLGADDLALSSLEQAMNERDVQLTEMNIEPAFDPLRKNPRFQKLLSRMNLS